MASATAAHDYYAVLEVSPDATLDDIKASYRRLARLHHPDKNIGSHEATAITQLINAAYEVLGDEAKRATYDHTFAGSQPSDGLSRRQRKRQRQKANAQTRANNPRPRRPKAPEPASEQRQQWLNYESAQMDLIYQYQTWTSSLESEIADLKAKISSNWTSIITGTPAGSSDKQWSTPARLTEMQKDVLRREAAECEAAVWTKQKPLDKGKARLQQLWYDLEQYRVWEDARYAAERGQQ